MKSLVWFTGIFDCQALFIISSSLKVNLWITKCALTSFIALQMRSESNTLQSGETSVYFSRQCSSTPVGFGQGFLNKEQRYNSGSSPLLSWPVSSCCYLFPPLRSALQWQRYYDITDINKNARKSWKGSNKMASRTVFNTFTVAGRSAYLHMWNILKEIYLKWL